MPEEPRQFVQYAFYQVDPAWRQLPEEERVKGVSEAVAFVKEASQRFIVKTISTLRIRAGPKGIMARECALNHCP